MIPQQNDKVEQTIGPMIKRIQIGDAKVESDSFNSLHREFPLVNCERMQM